MTNYHDIEHPAAYEAAIKRNIVYNARKTFFKNYDRAGEVLDHLGSRAERYGDEFAKSLLKAFGDYGKLTPKQYDAVCSMIDNAAERRAEFIAKDSADAEPVIDGRIQVTGTVISIKWVDSQFGTTTKILVKDDRNFKVWGSAPSSIDDTLSNEPTLVKGSRVTFTATVTASVDDNTFGFYKRPTKAELLA